MPIVYNPASPYNKELALWDLPKSRGGYKEDDPSKMQFPKMLYRADHYKGKRVCFAPDPITWEYNTPEEFNRAKSQVEQFNKACILVVNDEREESRAKENGWRADPKSAVNYLELRDDSRDEVAAHRAYEDRGMSELAQKEIAAAEAATDFNVAEVPVKRKGGRPRKIKAAIAEA